MKKCRLIILVLLTGFLSFTCSKKDEDDIPDGVKQIINTIENCTCSPQISQFYWRNRTIYTLGYSSPNCSSSIPPKFDENGNVIEIPFEDFETEAVFIKTVWKCNETKL